MNDATTADWITGTLKRVTRTAPASGIFLLLCAVVALVWANSPWQAGYHALWETPVSLGVGTLDARLTVHLVINDGLMAVFFFLVGLEIKRALLVGELASLRRAALPVAAAIGGMVMPALIFALLNRRGTGSPGWGIPMATDIAFALGVLALLGRRIPPSLRVFLSALAIVDDLGAVLVIALFYTASVSWPALAAAAALLGLSVAANVGGVRAPWAYALIGAGLWVAVLLSGVHATVAGVLLAFTIPSRTRIDEGAFLDRARRALDQFHAAGGAGRSVLSSQAHQDALHRLEELTEQAQAPLARLEHGLWSVVNFGVMPLFALANAGVHLRDAPALAATPIALGVYLGLVVGKTTGISLAAWLAVRSRLAVLPAGTSWAFIHGAAWLGGIGFTMSLFIAGLAFGDSAELLASAKIGTIAGSLTAGTIGWIVLRRAGTLRYD